MRKILPPIIICLLTMLWSSGIYAQTTFTSIATGNWNDGTTWNQAGATPGSGDNVVISNTHTVTLTAPRTIVDVDIQSGGVLDAVSFLFTVTGNLTVNGNYTSNTSAQNLDVTPATSANIDGSGTITINNTGSVVAINGTTTVLSSADLTINGNLTLVGSTLTNNGTVTVSGNVNGFSGTPSFINSTNSKLSVGGLLMNTGNLTATATDNVIEYTSSSNQNIKTPVSGTYYNLVITGTATFTMQAALIITDTLRISSGTFSTSASNFNLNIGGDFIIGSTFTEGTGAVTLDGSANQNLSITTDNTFYDLTINNSGGNIVANNNIAVTNALTMTSGNIDMSANTLTLGTSTANEGTLNFTSGRIIGAFERWINSTPVGGFTFPIGVAANNRTVALGINTLTTGGSVTASFVESSPGNSGIPFFDGAVEITSAFADGYWDLSAANGFAITSYDLDLTGDGFNSAPPPSVDMDTRLIFRSTSGSNWGVEGTHVNATGTTAERDGLSTFPGQYAFGDDAPCTPPVTSAISGNTDVCTGDTGEIYSVTQNGTNTYSWSITGGTIDSGDGTNSISVTWGSTGQIGNLSVVENNGTCSGDPVSLNVTINSIAPTAITGETSVAENTTGYTYSVTDMTNYSYTWTITGGTLMSGDGTNSIVVDWGVAGAGNVSVVAQRTGCAAAPAFDIDVTIFGTFIPQANGDWAVGATWVGDVAPSSTDNVRITGGFAVSTSKAETINNLIIDAGNTLDVNDDFTVDGSLQIDGTNGIMDVLGSLTANGDITVDGQLNISGANNDLNVSGSATSPVNTIEGTGTISIASGFLSVQNADKEIASGSQLTLSTGDFDIASSLTVTNNGNIIINGNLDGSATSTWINAIGSNLSIGGQLMSTGNLTATATDNVIEYTSGSNQNIKTPSSSTYYNLAISGTATFTMQTALIITDTLRISSGTFSTSASNFNLNIGGDFIIGGTFTEGTGAVTLDGSANQNLSITTDNTFYDLTINNSGGNIVANNNIAVTNALTMTSGNIDMSADTLTLGTSTANEGTLNFTSGRIIGAFERWINSTPVGGFTFPIGVAANDRTVLLNINTLTMGGSAIASFIESDPGEAGLPLTDGTVELLNTHTDGYWDLGGANGLDVSNYDLDLTGGGFNDPPLPSMDDDTTRILYRAAAVNNWSVDGTHVNADSANAIARRTGLTAVLGQYAFGDATACTNPVTEGITGNTEVCTDSTATYLVTNPTSGNVFTWSVVGGTINGTSSGLDVNSVNVTWGSTGQAGSVSVIESDGICDGAQVTLNVNINTIAPTAITGDTEVPENTNGFIYSVTAITGYDYTWTIQDGTIAVDNGDSVTVNWGASSGSPGNVSVVAQDTTRGCAAAPAFAIDVTIFGTIVSTQTGDWTDGATWVGGVAPTTPDNVVIANGHTVTTVVADTVNHLIIEDGGTLNPGGNFVVNADLQIDGLNGTINLSDSLIANGDVIIDGQLNISGTGNDFLVAGSDTSPVNTISGTGTIAVSAGSVSVENADKEILSGSNLVLEEGSLSLAAGITISNFGGFTISNSGDIIGADATSGWTNEANSNLNVTGDLLITGTLSASATDNTVTYSGGSTVDIKPPSDSYFNLTIDLTAANNTRRLNDSVDIDGNFNLTNGQLQITDPDDKIFLAGDWNNTGATMRGTNNPKVIFNGTADQTIINTNPSVNFDSITINNGANLTIQSGSRVNIVDGIDFINGIFMTSSTGLLVYKNGTGGVGGTNDDGNGSSYVDGPVSKVGNDVGGFNFPVGDGSIWAPLSIRDPQMAASTDSITVEYFDSSPANTDLLGANLMNVSTVEYWDVEVSAGAGFNIDMIFFWKDSVRSFITDSADLRIAHFSSSSMQWEALIQTTATFGVQGDITVENVSSFSPFTFGSNSETENPLPVELLSFEAKLLENQTHLNWATASEVNNDFFEVQRSEDGKEWEIVGEVDGNGTVNEVIIYDFIDARPLFGKSFYRLRQVDFDGQFEYSPVVSVDNPFTGQAMQVMLFPNPTNAQNINLRVFTGNMENRISVQLIDALGHRFIDEIMNPEAFDQDLTISPRESLAKGVYFLIVTQNNEAVRQRLIID